MAVLAMLPIGSRAARVRYVCTDLGTLGGGNSRAYGINDAGQVVGQSYTASGEERAFLWQAGVMTDLGTLGGDYSEACAINNAGQVVGQSNNGAFGDYYRCDAFLWQYGVMTDLGTLGGNVQPGPRHQQRRTGGRVPYTTASSMYPHAFLWPPMTDLGCFLPGSWSWYLEPGPRHQRRWTGGRAVAY